jgi:drug/metabolite transporter (DMT)-like permease
VRGTDLLSASIEPAVLEENEIVEALRTTAQPAKPRVNTPRRTRRRHTFLLVVLVTLLNCLGNLSLAWGMKHAAVQVGLSPSGYLRDMLNPFVALGIALLILWLLTRMALLSWADLSFVLPVTAVGYFLAAVAGRVFLDEPISRTQWLGTLLIFAGTVLVGSTGHKTRHHHEVRK